MSSLVLLEAKIPSLLYVTGKNNVMFFWALMVALVAFSLYLDVVEVMVVRMVHFFLTRGRHRMTP